MPVLLPFFCIYFVFLVVHVISESISKFTDWLDVRTGLINRSFISRSLKGRYYGNLFCGQIRKFGRLHLHSAVWRVASRNVLQDRNSNFERLNANDSSTLYRKLVRFGTVIPEFTTLGHVQGGVNLCYG